MTLSIEQQFDKFKSAATMVAFAVPHVGGAIAAVISGADLIWSLITRFPQNTDPMAQSPTVGDLVQLKLDLINAIGNALVQKDLQDAFQDVADWTTNLHGAVSWAQHDNGLTFTGTFATPADEQTWVDDKNKILRNPLTPDAKGFRPMVQTIEAFQNASQFRLKTAGLYVAAVNCLMLYCKINMIWDYTLLMRDHMAAVDQHNAAAKTAAQAMLKYNLMNPKVGPPPTMPPEVAAILAEADAQKASPWVRIMVDELGGPDTWRAALVAGKSQPDTDPATGEVPDKGDSHVFLSTLMALRDEVKAVIAKAEGDALARDAQITVMSDGSGGWYWNDGGLTPNVRQNGTTDQTRAQIGRDAYSGTIAAGIWNAQVEVPGYGEYTQTALDTLDQIIASWQLALSEGAKYLASYDGVAAPPIYDA